MTATQERTANHCPTCACAPTNGYREGGLSYGPVGNPDSTDPWVWAQARVADGWHVEGQVVRGYYAATNRTTREMLRASTLHELVAETHKAGPR